MQESFITESWKGRKGREGREIDTVVYDIEWEENDGEILICRMRRRFTFKDFPANSLQNVIYL